MRDLALIAIVVGSLPLMLWRPHIGVLMWVWIGVMNPHRLTWSFAYHFNFAAMVAAATLVGVLIGKQAKGPPISSVTSALVLFAAWTGVTTLFALYPDESFEQWKTLLKTLLMVLLIPTLFHKKEDLRVLLWVVVLSIAYYGTKGGLWTILTGGVARVYGPAESYIEDNNAIAAAIVMMIPLMRYLQLTTPHKYVRWGLTAMMLLCGVAVLGSYSRGAFLAVMAMLAFLWWKGRHKVPVLIFALVAIPTALSVMPEKWYGRMETIRSYHEEGSGQMRLNAWGTMFNLAKARPLVGGGFDVAEREVYARYSPDPRFPPQTAHSIYFQALGEHGFVGLFLYLFLFAATWRQATKVIRLAKDRPDLSWARDLSRMAQVTLVGFAVGGAFLSLVLFDVPYYIAGAMAATLAIVKRELRLHSSEPQQTRGAGVVQPALRRG